MDFELTKEQQDWNDIYELSKDKIDALKLAKENVKYDYLRTAINKLQAVLEMGKEKIERNIKLKRGYWGHIYECHIENRIKKIKLEDSK